VQEPWAPQAGGWHPQAASGAKGIPAGCIAGPTPLARGTESLCERENVNKRETAARNDDETRTFSYCDRRVELAQAVSHDAVFEVPAGRVHPVDAEALCWPGKGCSGQMEPSMLSLRPHVPLSLYWYGR
jgi:hypothetical protein